MVQATEDRDRANTPMPFRLGRSSYWRVGDSLTQALMGPVLIEVARVLVASELGRWVCLRVLMGA